MDTIRAISQMAVAEADGNDGSRTAGAAHLNRTSPGLHDAAIASIRLVGSMGLKPADDRATQARLASAVGRSAEDRGDAESRTSGMMKDFLLQEAAAARLVASGGQDPLGHVSDPGSSRGALEAASMLKRSGVGAHPIFDRASDADMSAIASGRYDRIQAEHTRFAISAQLRMSARAMASPGVDIPAEKIEGRGPPYPSTGASKGPERVGIPVGFGRKGAAER